MRTQVNSPSEVVAAELRTNKEGWKLVGSFASAGDEPGDLASNERTYLGVAAAKAAGGADNKIVMYEIPPQANGMRLRIVGTTENTQVVLSVWAGAKEVIEADCILSPRGTLTWTIGSQASPDNGYLVADTVVITGDDASSSEWGSASPGDNSVAEAFIDLQGDTELVIVPTVLGCDAKLYAKSY